MGESMKRELEPTVRVTRMEMGVWDVKREGDDVR
jgi:hypothetical protein